MANILPVFSSHYSYKQGGMLTLSLPGTSKPGNPVSVFDIAKDNGLTEVVLVESKMDGFVEAVKNAEKSKLNKLIFGLKLVIENDEPPRPLKDGEFSVRGNSSIVIFLKSLSGYSSLVKIYNKANLSPSGMINWSGLCELWSEDLIFALPFFSSFLAKNALDGHTSVPKFPVSLDKIVLMREAVSGIPFDFLINYKINEFISTSGNKPSTLDVKTIYYKNKSDFKKYQVYRAILNRAEYSKPEVDHFCSEEFSWESFQLLNSQS